MPNGSRFSRRHLLAVCTFLLPLGLLAWLGAAELRRQGQQVRAALEGQALAFLRTAAVTIEQRLGAELPAFEERSREALAAAASPVLAVRELREHHGLTAALDLLLLDERGAVIAPTPPPVDLGLPLYRPVRLRQNPLAEIQQAAEILAARGDHGPAVESLQPALDQFLRQPRRPAAQALDLVELEARVRLQLATSLRRLSRLDESRQQLQQLRTLLESQPNAVLRDANLLGLDLLAAVALAELDPEPGSRLRLMRAIAEGGRDLLADGLLAAVMERLMATFPTDTAEYPSALDATATDRARRHGRAFADDYELLLLETVRRRLRQGEEGRTLYHAFAAGEVDSLLAVRRAAAVERERHGCAFVCLRLDLGLLLAAAILPDDDPQAFVLAVEDDDGVPVLGTGPVAAPEGFDPPVLHTYGLRLRALPANADALIAAAAATARNRALLLTGLFLVAVGGAVWLWRSVSRATELAALKVDFVSRVSHELKTPLALIRMYGETLDLGRARDPEQVRRFGGIVAREADRLAAMIQRILDFSRQQTGTVTYQPEPADLREVLTRMAEDYRPHLESKGAAVRLHLQEGVRCSVDSGALESAVVNLLENAVKYALAVDPDLTVDLELCSGDGMARIDVADRGRGVPEDERERIFESFFRAGNAGVTRGAGLGLSLVRHFAEAHGGTVRVLPRVGGGAIFRITLPLLEPCS